MTNLNYIKYSRLATTWHLNFSSTALSLAKSYNFHGKPYKHVDFIITNYSLTQVRYFYPMLRRPPTKLQKEYCNYLLAEHIL